MTQPGIEPPSPGTLANTLLTIPMGRLIIYPSLEDMVNNVITRTVTTEQPVKFSYISLLLLLLSVMQCAYENG